MDDQTIRESILLSVKKVIGGLEGSNPHFDTDLIIFINSTFTSLAQLGVGPASPFKIESDEDLWSSFDYDDIEAVKEYMVLKVKLVFDPPLNGSVMQAYKDRIAELEWRMNVFAEEIKDEQ